MLVIFRLILILIGMTTFFSVNAQETKAPKFGEGLFNLIGKDSTFSMNLSARMQFLGTIEWDSKNNELSNSVTSLLVRRARLNFEGFAYSPRLRYKLELGLSNSDIGIATSFTNEAPKYILDAVVKWNFSGNFVFWFGQTKLPGNRERVISSGSLQQVERSLLNSRFNIDRDMGFQLRHHFKLSDTFIVKEAFSFSQGEGRNVTTRNLGGHQYTSRIELLPFGNFTNKGDYIGSDLSFEPAPKLALGFTYDFNNDAVKNRSNLGSYMVNDMGFYATNISTIFIDAMYKYKGFSFMGEYAYRDAKDPYAKNSDGTLTGDVVQVGNALNLQSGYLLSKTLEISGRYTNIDWDQDITGKGNENQYTLGLSKYILGHKLKVQTDLSYLDSTDNSNQIMYRFQVDIQF